MCRKLKEIHDLKASDILHRYFVLQPAPHSHINVSEILNMLNISHEPVCFEELEESLFLTGNDIILGMACSQGDDVRILYSNKLRDKEANYILAHEFAHCCLHLPVSAEFHVEMKMRNDIYSSFLSKPLKNRQNSKKEKEADEFALELLLPSELFIDYIIQSEVCSIEDISNHFVVPEFLVHKKIESLS